MAGHRHCCLADRRWHETVNGRGGPTWGVGAGPAPPSGGGNGRVGGSSLLVACWRGARERAPRARSSVGAHIVAPWAGQATQRDPGLLLSPPGQCRRWLARWQRDRQLRPCWAVRVARPGEVGGAGRRSLCTYPDEEEQGGSLPLRPVGRQLDVEFFAPFGPARNTPPHPRAVGDRVSLCWWGHSCTQPHTAPPRIIGACRHGVTRCDGGSGGGRGSGRGVRLAGIVFPHT